MKIQFATLALVLLTPLLALADESPVEPAEGPNWTVQVDPLTTALGFVHVQIERKLGSQASFYAGPHLRLFSSPFTDPEDFLGYGVEMGVRWYFLGTALRGFWGGLRGVVAYLTTDANGPEETGIGGYGSVLGGYTWILGDRWVLSAGAGIQYLHYTVGGLGPEGIAPAAHTTIGFAF